jgi:hypothetical protein
MRIAWLIERNSNLWGAEWFCGGNDRWTKDANKAVQFPDKDSAVEVDTLLLGLKIPKDYPYTESAGDWDYTYSITEHGFIDAP